MQLYGTVLIPQAVFREITLAGVGRPGSIDVQTLPWIVTEGVTDLPFIASLRQELNEGESEAIALAIQEDAGLLLLDERQGRGVAFGWV